MMASTFALALLAAAAPQADAAATKESRMTQVRYGECVIAREYKAAREFVLNPLLEEPALQRLTAKVTDGKCLIKSAPSSLGSVRMRFPLDTMRFSLAEALVRREFAAGPVMGIEAAAPLSQLRFDPAFYEPKPGQKLSPKELEDLKFRRDYRLARAFLGEFGECVVRANPAASHALLLTSPVTPEESRAFNSLSAVFGNCIAGGPNMSLDKSVIRGTVALNYYRLAHAPRIATPTAGATR